MDNEFIKWIDGIKAFIAKRVGKYATVWVHTYKDSVAICIDCANGMRFHYSFDQTEFDMNNYHQRRSLAKIRRKDMVWQMQEHCEEIMQVANKLK